MTCAHDRYDGLLARDSFHESFYHTWNNAALLGLLSFLLLLNIVLIYFTLHIIKKFSSWKNRKIHYFENKKEAPIILA